MKRIIIAALLAVAAFLCAACGLFRPSPEKQLGLLLEDAERLELAGNYEEAVLKYEAAIVIEPKNAALYAATAAAYIEIGDYDNAAKNYKNAIQYEPDEAEHYLALSALYATDGDTDGAAKVLQAAYSAIPEDADIIKGINVLAESAFSHYLNERLLPQRGLSSFFTVDEGGWFSWRADGLIGACLFDLDLDGIDEMLVFEHVPAYEFEMGASLLRSGTYADDGWPGVIINIFSFSSNGIVQTDSVAVSNEFDIYNEFFIVEGQDRCYLVIYKEGDVKLNEAEVFTYTQGKLELVIGITTYAPGIETWIKSNALYPASDETFSKFRKTDEGQSSYMTFVMQLDEYNWDEETMVFEEFWALHERDAMQKGFDTLLLPIGLKFSAESCYEAFDKERFSALAGYRKHALMSERPSFEGGWDFAADGHRDVLGDDVRWLPLGSASTDPQDMRGRALAAYAALLRSGPQLYEDESFAYSIELDAFGLADINGDGIEELIAGEVDDHPYDGVISQEPNVDNVNIYTYTDTGIRLLDSIYIGALQYGDAGRLDLVDGRYLLTYDHGTSGYYGYYFGEWDGAGELVWTRYSTYAPSNYDNEIIVYARNEEPISEQEFNNMPKGDTVPVKFYYNNETTRAEMLGE